jgi:hypothetical protein
VSRVLADTTAAPATRWRFGPVQAAGGAVFLAAGLYAGLLPVLFQGALALGLWWLLKRFGPASRRPVNLPIAIFGVQTALVLINQATGYPAITAPLGWVCLVVVCGLTAWLYASLTRAAAWGCIVYHGLALVDYLALFVRSPASSHVWTLKLIWIVSMIAGLALFIRDQSEGGRLRRREIVEAFD